MKRISSLCLLCTGILIGFLCGTLTPSARSDQPKTNYDQVVAQVGETKITRGDLAEQVLLMKGQVQNQLGLDELCKSMQDRAIVKEVARQQGVSVTDDEIDQRIKDNFEVSHVAANEQPPHSVLVENFRTLLLVEKMAGITVNEKEAQDYYKDPHHAYLFAHPNMAKLIIISNKNRDKAIEAYNRLKDGEDPHALSAALSDVPDLKKKRGDVGWLLDRSVSPEISNKLFGMKPDGSQAMKPKQYTNVFQLKVPNPVPEKDLTKPDEPPVQTYHIEYWVVYVDDIKLAYLPKYDQVKLPALCYARTEKYVHFAPQWFYDQAKSFNDKQSWKQVTDLSNPAAALTPMDIDLHKYVDEK